MPFINNDINNKRIDELCERFGLARTSGYKLPSAEKPALPEASKIEETHEKQDGYEAEIEEVVEEPTKESQVPINEEGTIEESIPVVIVKEKENDVSEPSNATLADEEKKKEPKGIMLFNPV